MSLKLLKPLVTGVALLLLKPNIKLKQKQTEKLEMLNGARQRAATKV
jgi:hypothetical protein